MDKMTESKNVVVIPARYASSRFPGKPLATIGGRPMIELVYEQASSARLVEEVIVATDHEEIFTCVEGFGGRAVMTAENHPSGTDRIAEAIEGTDADLIINLQGDEPLMPPEIIDELIEKSVANNAEMATVATVINRQSEEATDPNIVKVVLDNRGFALYFSRSPIPFLRENGLAHPLLGHWGIYLYKRSLLQQFVGWAPGGLEQCEMLEQLRALEHGVKIFVVITDKHSIGVDHPEDIRKVETILNSNT